ncbi:MAG: ATP-binding protein [Candidatus Korarchaeota archaeon]|nr:ATP-binding protein [Candidatus Korarchaeota archaeon]
MGIRASLEEVVEEFLRLGIPDLKRREVSLPRPRGRAVVVTGLRRAGKTFLLYQTMGEYLNSGKNFEELLYVNLEDNRLEGITSKDLSYLVEVYASRNPHSREMYLFLDEVQVVPGWERFVRRLLERRSVHIFVTGSSSRLLSYELASTLRGRSLTQKLFPLSFREFLLFKGFSIPQVLTEDDRGAVRSYLREYLVYGGFPELVMYDEILKVRTLQEYLDLVIYRDLVERYGIEKLGALRALIRATVRNFARKSSVRRLHTMLLSMGARISVNKVYEYFSYLEDVGFVLPIRKLEASDIESMRTIPKLYLMDNGFPTIYGVKDDGFRMENLVAVELLRRKYYWRPLMEVYYWESRGKEVDFVVKEGGEIRELIQVSASLDHDVRRREFTALSTASTALGCKNLKVITGEEEGVEEWGGRRIELIPLWKWLLSGPVGTKT